VFRTLSGNAELFHPEISLAETLATGCGKPGAQRTLGRTPCRMHREKVPLLPRYTGCALDAITIETTGKTPVE